MNAKGGTGEVLICGAGGLAVEVVAEFRASIGGIYDPYSKEDDFEGLTVFRSLAEASHSGLRRAVIAVGHPRVARRIASELDHAGLSLASPLISPRATVTGGDVEIGDGTMIMSGTVLTEHIRVGRSCILNLNCTVGHGARMGDFVSIMPLTAISGGVTLGDDCYVGSQAFVMEGIHIAPRSTIGAMAGVFRDIDEPGGTWIGSPARRMEGIQPSEVW
jgi:sugar O-acyltransferase (sialic acid O-acetyltransferase NeuD family)